MKPFILISLTTVFIALCYYYMEELIYLHAGLSIKLCDELNYDWSDCSRVISCDWCNKEIENQACFPTVTERFIKSILGYICN